MALIYCGKRQQAGVLFVPDRQGYPLDSPETRMNEWADEFKQRFKPHVPAEYGYTFEAPGEEWNDSNRDEDAIFGSPKERWRQLGGQSSLASSEDTIFFEFRLLDKSLWV